MSVWTKGTYTHKGLALLSKLTQGYPLKITKAVAGTGYVNAENLANQAAVTGVKQTLSFGAATYPENGTCKLPVFLSNKNVAAGYVAKQIGLYAYDPDVGEILYYIVQSAQGTEVPSAKDMPEYSATWNFYLHYGQADNVSVTVDPSHTVTPDMLAEVRAIAESGVSAAKQGKTVVCENTANLPLAGLRIFGKTTQNGTPTPDSPVELVSISKPTIGVTGKNLLPIGTVTFEVTEMYTPEVPIPAGDYWLSCNIVSTDTDGNYSTIVFQKNGKDVLYLPVNRGDVSRKITLKDSADRVQLCAAHNNTQGVGDTATWSNIQLERSDKFTGYEAYKQPRTITLDRDMNGIPVTSGGNHTDENGQQWICDEIDFARGVHIQRVGRKVLDGTESWEVGTSVLNGMYRFYTWVYDMKPDNSGFGVCTHYPRTPLAAEQVNSECVRFGQGNIALFFLTQSVTTVQAWKEYVAGLHTAGTPIIIHYVLAAPIETALTAEELAAYAAMTSHNPVTTVTNDAGAWMEVDCIKAQHENAFRVANSGRTIESLEHPGCFYRIVDGKVEWINPPMVAETEYRTAERFIGKPVYAMIKKGTPNSGAAEISIAFPLTDDPSFVIAMQGSLNDGNILPCNTNGATVSMRLNPNDGTVSIVRSSGTFSPTTIALVWLKYIKTGTATLLI